MIRRSPTLLVAAIVATCFAGFPAESHADTSKHTLRADAALALMVGAQADRFSLGGGAGGGYEYRIIPHLGVEARYGAFFFPTRDEAAENSRLGTAHSIALGLRLYPLPKIEAGDLWIGAGGGAILTGDLTRGGVDAGIGFEFNVHRILKLGPFIRYAHVFQPADHALGGQDAGFLQIGLSLALQPSRRPQAVPVEEEEPEPLEEEAEPAAEAEEDEAFQEDEEEPEPYQTAHGRPESTGEREMREVAERILFPNNSDEPIRETMTAVLRVAQLIHDHPEWEKITIEGHASETGSTATNFELSRQRAERMKQILVDFGIDPERIEVVAKGKSELEVRGRSESAHAQNRRVVFIVTVIR